MILVSIILPVYNGEKHLKEAIESCLLQSYKNIELIIINDCSTDNTLQIITHFAKIDDRIKVVNNSNNLKLPASLNIGHRMAKGDYLTWTSDDNFFELNAISEMLIAIKKSSCEIVYSNFQLINSENNVIRIVKLDPIENLIFGNYIGCCFLYHRTVFEKNEGYDEKLFLVEDYDFWLRATLHSRFFQIPQNLYNYRVHQESLTAQIKNDKNKNKLWKTNTEKMYQNLCNMLSKNSNISAINFLTYTHTNTYRKFEYIVNYDVDLSEFWKIWSKNNNFNKSNLKKKILKQYLNWYFFDDKNPRKAKDAFFLFIKFMLFISPNNFKSIIKHNVKFLWNHS